MANPNQVIPNIPIPTQNNAKEVEKEIILKENFNEAFIQKVNSGNFSFVLPDEVKVIDEKKVTKK